MKWAALLLVGLAFALASAPARADDSSPCDDAYTNAQILRRRHALLEARAALKVCAQSTCPRFIVRDCSGWLDDVQASLPSIVPVATDASGNNLPDVKLAMDGAPLLERVDGRSVDVNPGEHTVTFETPNGEKSEKHILVAEGEKRKRVAVAFGASAQSPEGPVEPEAQSSVSTMPQRAPRPKVPWKAIGITTTAVGVVGVGVGAYFGLEALAKRSDAGCAAMNVCPSTPAANTLSRAQSAADASTAFFVGGAVVMATGIVLWILSPGDHRDAPPIAWNATGLVLAGPW